MAQAEADARTALELLTSHHIRFGTAHALGLLIEALIERGTVQVAWARSRVLYGSLIRDSADTVGGHPMIPIIAATALGRRYRDQAALDNVSLTVKPGTVTGLLGL